MPLLLWILLMWFCVAFAMAVLWGLWRREQRRPAVYIPGPADPPPDDQHPMTPTDQADTAAAWPHLVSSYYQEDHHEH